MTFDLTQVTVIDANSPADVLESFHVCSSHLLCIASVPGAKETDFRVDEELSKRLVRESEDRASAERDAAAAKEQKSLEEATKDLKPEEIPGGGGIGSISFVSCETGKEEEGVDSSPAAAVQAKLDSLEQEPEQGS